MKKRKTCDFSKLKIGDRLSETQYYEITDIKKDKIVVTNERNFTMDIETEIVEEGLFHASQHTSVKQISRTDLARLLQNVGDSIFTICFHKQPSIQHCIEVLDESKSRFSKMNTINKREMAKRITEGPERILVGHLIRSEPLMGRSQVRDMENNGFRIIDHRRINWIIWRGVMYISKIK